MSLSRVIVVLVVVVNFFSPSLSIVSQMATGCATGVPGRAVPVRVQSLASVRAQAQETRAGKPRGGHFCRNETPSGATRPIEAPPPP